MHFSTATLFVFSSLGVSFAAPHANPQENEIFNAGGDPFGPVAAEVDTPTKTVDIPDAAQFGSLPSGPPSGFPTCLPSQLASQLPSGFPTCLPSGFPSRPSGFPAAPSGFPSGGPSGGFPTCLPSQLASQLPSGIPTCLPSGFP